MSTGAPSRTSVGGTGSARLHRSPVPSSHVSSAISTQQQQLSPHLNNANASPAGPFDFNESFLTVSRPSLPRQGGGKQRHLSTRARALARASIAGATTPANNVFAVQIDGDDGGIEVRAVQSSLLQAVCLRANYKSKDRGQYEVGLSGGADPSAPPPRTLHLEDGIFSFLDQRTVAVSWEDYYDDVTALLDSVNDPSCQRACRRRLHVLEQKYNLYELCNGDAEKGADRYRRGAGLFSDACCVDNNIVLAHATSSPQLIDFMMDKIEKHSEDVVAITRDREGAGETPETLGRVCTLLDLADPQSLTPEGLGLQPLSEKPIVFYDPLDPRANPGGANSVELLRLFLTPHTLNQGAYLAECVVGSTLDANDARVRCPQATEMILDVSGVLPDEWEGLAAWVRQHHLLNYRTNRFQIRITRPVKRRRGAGNGAAENSMMGATGAASGLVGGEGVLDDSENLLNAHLSSRFSPSVTPLVFDSHQQHLDSLFLPLFHATLAPEDPKNADLAALLEQVGSIDLVLDSAAGGERSSQRRRRRPADVPWSEPVDDLYFSYYVWANLCSLNAFRRRRGMNTFQLRGAAGRLAGSSSPKLGLVIAFLLCDHVLDGLALMDAPVLQYLYALHRIGVSVSPTASSSLGATTYTKHPLRSYLRSGLRVSLGTSSPLLFHVSSQPLVEEYNTARRLFKLGGADLCELALNSVTMSSFDASTLATWIGEPFAAELEKLQHSTVMLPMERHATLTAAASSNGSASPDMGKRPSNTTPTPTAAGARLPESVGELIAYFVNNDVLSEAWRQNAVELTAVPTSRLEFRWETWAAELDVLISAADAAESSAAGGGAGKTSLPTTSAVAVAEGEPQQQQLQQQSEGALVEKGKQAPSKRPSVSIRHGTVDEVPSSSLAQLLQHGGVRPRAPYVVTDPALDFPRVALTGPYDRDTQFATAAQAIARALVLRHEYMQQLKRPDDCGGEVRSLFALIQNPLYQTEEAFKTRGSKKEKSSSGPDGYVFDEDEWMYKTVEGVVVPHEVHQIPRLPQDMYHFDDFKHHVEELRALMENPLIRSFATSRLRMLERRFSLHVAVNHSREAGTTTAKASQNRDFYQSTKVDNTVRMECGMTSRQLLDFILSKAHNNGDDIVSHQRGKEPQTLRQLLHELDISVESLTVDDLNVQGDTASGSQASTLYKPDGRDELLTLVLKTDNRMNGRYFAELTKHVFENMKRDRYTFSENRLSIYGQSPEEWSLLSSWFDTHGMSSSHNQWVIQLPRIYGYLRKHGRVQNFAEYLENIFKPLWSISLHPSKDPRLFHCVNHITGFDCVEDEHRTDIPLHTITQPPHEWTSEEDPPYNYYLYHLWANVSSLNEFRRRRRFSTFTLRPSCGESGSLDHLIGGFLLSNSISYGVQLVESDVLQYLYYLAQIGVTMCPLSNNGKVLSYLAHPFPKFFRRGLKVSLGTDCPLLFHHTQEPLIEEYSIASKIWKLSPNDMCEIARNSVLLSGFSPVFKQERLGELYFLSSSRSNDASRTHVSDIRVAYRFEAVHGELGFLEYISGHSFPKPVLTLNDEAALEQEYTQRLCQLREQPLQGVLIDANPDNTDIDALQRTRTHMQKQLEELQFTLSGLQKQNKQLTEKLADEREREQQVSVMRRHQVASRANDELQGYERLLLQQHMAGMTSEEQKTFRDRLEREEPGVLLAEVNASARFPLRGGMPTTTTTMPQSQDDGAALDVAEESGNRAWQLQDSPGDWGLAMDDFYMQGQRGGGGGESGAAATHPNNAVQPLAGSAEDGSGLIVTSRSGPLRPLASTATGTVTLNRGALLGLSETMWAKGTEEGPVEVGRARAEDAVGNADAVKGKHSDGAASQRTRRGQEGGAGLPPVRAGRISSASFSVPSTGRLGKGDDGVTRTMPPRY